MGLQRPYSDFEIMRGFGKTGSIKQSVVVSAIDVIGPLPVIRCNWKFEMPNVDIGLPQLSCRPFVKTNQVTSNEKHRT